MQMFPSAILKWEYSETGATRWHNQKSTNQIYALSRKGRRACIIYWGSVCFPLYFSIFSSTCQVFSTWARHEKKLCNMYYIHCIFMNFSCLHQRCLRHKCKIQTKTREWKPNHSFTWFSYTCCSVIIFPRCFKIPNHVLKSSLCRLNLPLSALHCGCVSHAQQTKHEFCNLFSPNSSLLRWYVTLGIIATQLEKHVTWYRKSFSFFTQLSNIFCQACCHCSFCSQELRLFFFFVFLSFFS